MKNRKKIKVGILTLPFNNNYGGILQTFALQTWLKKFGYTAVHIYRDFPEKNVVIQFIKNLAKFLTGKTKAKKNKRYYTFRFFDKHISPKTERITTPSDFKEIKRHKFSTIIVGSDQVWRKEIIYGPLKMNYFLDFADSSITKISYAASFGLDSWQFDETETELIKKQIQTFKAVSVREKSGVELCKKYLSVNATHVIDPVMLLSKEDYINLFKHREKKNNSDCLVYLLDFTEQKQMVVDAVSNTFNYKTFHINEEVIKSGFRTKLSVESWLKAFYETKFVVTDSFHGCLFSIIFNKPFLIIGNEKRGLARFNSVLNDFGLTDRMILKEDENYSSILRKPIDWEFVNNRLEVKQKEAQNFLISNIN